MYHYECEKKNLFTDRGQRYFLEIRDTVMCLIDKAGAFKLSHVLHGDSWQCMACVDRMVEIGEIIEITIGMNVKGQDRVFVRSN